MVFYPQLGVSPTNHTDAVHPEEASQASFSAHTSEMTISILGSVYHRELPTSGDGSFVLCYHSRRVNTALTHPPCLCSKEMCDHQNAFTMCPLCDKSCDYWNLSSACGTARASHLFDNPATVFFSIFMALWGKLSSQRLLNRQVQWPGREGHRLRFIYLRVFSSYAEKYLKHSTFSSFGNIREKKHEYPLWFTVCSLRGVMLTPYWPQV